MGRVAMGSAVALVAAMLATPVLAQPGSAAPPHGNWGPVPAMRLTPPPGPAAGARPGAWGANGWSAGAPVPPPPPGARPLPPGGGFAPPMDRPLPPGHAAFAGRPGGAFGPGYLPGRPGREWHGSYQRPVRGYRLPSYFVTPSFFVGDFASWGLFAPGYGQHWVRYYDDAVLIDERGAVLDAREGIDWKRRGPVRGGSDADRAYDRGYDDGYQDGTADGMEAYADDSVSWHDGGVRSYSGGGYMTGGSYVGGSRVIYSTPGTTTVVVSSAPSVSSVTTTTTTTSYSSTSSARRTWVAKPHGKMRYRAPCRCK